MNDLINLVTDKLVHIFSEHQSELYVLVGGKTHAQLQVKMKEYLGEELYSKVRIKFSNEKAFDLVSTIGIQDMESEDDRPVFCVNPKIYKFVAIDMKPFKDYYRKNKPRFFRDNEKFIRGKLLQDLAKDEKFKGIVEFTMVKEYLFKNKQ